MNFHLMPTLSIIRREICRICQEKYNEHILVITYILYFYFKMTDFFIKKNIYIYFFLNITFIWIYLFILQFIYNI